jgi:glycosyltransferase involved in cell wall biosynthesis
VPSLLADAHPTIAIEALANGRPVIGTPSGGIPGIVGPAGWIVPPTVRAWADVLPRALDHDLVEVARDRYLRLFHPEPVTRTLLDVYASVTTRS